MLNRDPAKRLKLIDFAGLHPYALWEEEEMLTKIKEVQERHQD